MHIGFRQPPPYIAALRAECCVKPISISGKTKEEYP